jgi:hypothetical protein
VTLLSARHIVKREISRQEDSEIYTQITSAIFTNLNLDDNPIKLVEKDIEGEVEDNEEDAIYNLGEGYIDFKIIKETNNKVEYSR